MKTRIVWGFAAIVLALMVPRAAALSTALPQPAIFFPKGYDTNRAEQVLSVLRSNRFEYLGGLTSYWPPEWSTTLVYSGSAQTLKAFIAALTKVAGITVRISYSDDLAKETGSALRAGSWWVKYSHVEPDVITIRVNRSAPGMREKFEPSAIP